MEEDIACRWSIVRTGSTRIVMSGGDTRIHRSFLALGVFLALAVGYLRAPFSKDFYV
tara:strand:+ start:552 stop:722 length:171 start_codon:yes stop_codon:yes gene_type:complete